MTELEPVIGLEIHIQPAIESKLFCACSTEVIYAKPNSLICPVCTGQPGILPVLNKEAVTLAVKAALALNCKINETSIFARKNYFYPDCPKNYQITQHKEPLAENGFVEIEFDGSHRKIGIERLHLEEDAGKLLHDAGGEKLSYSLVDFNRSGITLAEIVTKPDMHSPTEAHSFLTTLKNIMQWADISNCDMEKGNLRVDVNLSLRPKGEKKLGMKVEIKNLNSFKAVKDALEYEIKRQASEIGEGRCIRQETRLWNDEKNSTMAMRSKEESHDYRYFSEPDLPPLKIPVIEINEIKKTLPELPLERKKRFIKRYKLSNYDAGVLTSNKNLADYFEKAANYAETKPKAIVNLLTTDLLGKLKSEKKEIADCPVTPAGISELAGLVESGEISTKMAKEVLDKMWTIKKSAKEIVASSDMTQISDETLLEKWVKEAIAANPKATHDIKNGKDKAIGALVGFVMKKSKGKANPAALNKIIKELIK